MIGKKSVTQRAAEALKDKSMSSADLRSLYDEVAQRAQELERMLKGEVLQRELDTAMASGDMEEVRAIRQKEADLRDQELVCLKFRSDLHHAVNRALGEEAMKAEAQHRKTLAKALEQAEKAQAMLEESQRMARVVALARSHAAGVGQALVFDRDTIRALAEAIHPAGNERKQLLLDLGIHESKRAAA